MKRNLNVRFRIDGDAECYYFDDRSESDSREEILGLSIRSDRKSKFSHPYSYDPFIVWFGDASKGDEVVYSDRLQQLDYTKYVTSIDTVRTKQLHQRFNIQSPEQVQEFLSLYYDKQVEVTAIVEGCNASNGYSYWIFYFRDKK